MADEVLHSGVRGVTDLMVMPGLINLDFADIRTVMSEMGKAMMGTGEADGERPRDRRRRGGDLQPAAGRRVDEGRPRRPHQHHRRHRHDPVRGRRGGQPHPRGGRPRRQHHLRLDLRRRSSPARCASRSSRPASMPSHRPSRARTASSAISAWCRRTMQPAATPAADVGGDRIVARAETSRARRRVR